MPENVKLHPHENCNCDRDGVALPPEIVLEVKNLTKEFYKNKKLFTAVDHISFQLQKGECLGIVGESGCGKTTTIKMITQLLKADSGEIWVDGKQIAGQKQQNRKEIKNLYTKIQKEEML